MSKAITFKVSEEESKILDQEAQENGMTRSQYIKARLFEDNIDRNQLNSKNLSDYEKDLISSSKKAFNLIYLVAESLVSKEKAQDIVERADKILIEKGYKNSQKKD